MNCTRFRSILILASTIAIGLHSTVAFAGVRLTSPIFRGPSHDKVVAITFDDGPDPRFTPRVLAILKEKKVPGTFFVLGENVLRHPDLARREVQEGHLLGNHTFTHPSLNHVSMEEAREEISKCEQAIQHITGTHPIYFRPPRGFYDERTMRLLTDMHYEPIFWSLAVEHHDAPTPQAMVERVLSKVQPGVIILAHDGNLDRENTVRALPGIIDGLKAKGYRFITLPEMIELSHKYKYLDKTASTSHAHGQDRKGFLHTIFHFFL